MAAGRRRHLPGDVLRRPLARPRGLPAAGRRPGAALALRSVPLRGRGHEARPARQGERGAPDLHLRRPARGGSRASGRSGCTSRSAAARERSSASASTTTWPTTARPRPILEAPWRTRSPPSYPPAETYPEPVEHCDVCRWAAECVARRRADDHLCLVAGISARQRRALTAPRTSRRWRDLGRLELPLVPPLEGTSAGALERVREQARIQLEGRLEGRPKYELLAARTQASRAEPSAAWRRCRSRRRATSSSTSRAIRMRSTTASTTCSACWTADGDVPRVLGARRRRASSRSPPSSGRSSS